MFKKKFCKFALSIMFLFSSMLSISLAQTTVFDLGQVLVSGDEDARKDLAIEEKTRISQKTLKAHKVVDLAEILSNEMIEASMIRKSGFGNEVGLRGFTQSNLRFSLDNTLIEGSCGSRKDPPMSHINLLTIQRIEVKQGPYDVRVPGALGGDINVITRDAQKGIHGEVLSKFGSFGYLSQGGYVTGGNDFLQGLFGYNYSQSDQYKDGAGNKLSSFNPNYSEQGKSLKAFKKDDFWGKVSITPDDRQKFIFSSVYGEGRDILTPRAGMDIEKEKTYLNKMTYSIKNLNPLSEQLTLSAYYNRIEHYPSGKYRTGPVNNRRNEAISTITGAQIENQMLNDIAVFTVGKDFYHRHWEINTLDRATGANVNHLLPSVNELNFGLYVKAERDFEKLSVAAGLRTDIFHSKASKDLKHSKAITGTNAQTDVLPSANIFLKYFLTDHTNIFGGIGLTNRMPTAVERYIQSNANFYGNPDLKPSRNFQTDFGFESQWQDRLTLRVKGFYSRLDNFIYQQNDSGVKTFSNINAYIVGADSTVDFKLDYGFILQGGISYQLGRKRSQPAGNDDKNLAEIAPIRTKLALTYEDEGFFATYEWVHSEKNNRIDRGGGERPLKGWDVFHFRAGYQFKQEQEPSLLSGLSLNFGIENMFDKRYAVANSYEYDPTDPGGANVRVVNEPGRFIYGSLSYRF